jgi:glutamate 5-kinase
MNRDALRHSQRWVIKIGSALLTSDGMGLNREGIAQWVAQMASLRRQGLELVLVSSGAVAEGMSRLGWRSRPHALHELQAAAAIGQMGLVQTYESAFQQYGMQTAQVLLTHDDLSNRKRYLNARSTLRTLLELNIVPVVNENDTVVFEEIRFGDNDTLAALVSNLIEADHLIILTDQAGLYDSDPRGNSTARLVNEADVDDGKLDAMVSAKGGMLGRGGMFTKLRAARLAARAGASTVIASGREPDVLTRLYQGEGLGSYLQTGKATITARKQWLAGHLQVHGKLHIDQGAARVLREQGRSLLAVGVKAVEGRFNRGEVVACLDEQGREVARGLINYSADEVERIKGAASDRIEALLGYVDEPEIIHRDNLVVL